MTIRIVCADGTDRERAVTAATAALRRGDLVILPSENSYLLAADAFSPRGTAALRAAKGQGPDTPLGLLIPRSGTVAGLATDLRPAAHALMGSMWPGMVTLLLTPQHTLSWDHPAGSPLAVRMPLHPVALAVVTRAGPTAASSITVDGGPVRDPVEAIDRHPEAAVALDSGPLTSPWSDREDHTLPSTVVDVREGLSIVREGAVDAARITAAAE